MADLVMFELTISRQIHHLKDLKNITSMLQ